MSTTFLHTLNLKALQKLSFILLRFPLLRGGQVDYNTSMLSAVILAQNEEEHIAHCLESVAFCDEIIVIDDESSDKTVEIAKKCGATVYTRPLKNDFSAQRTFGAQKATNDWMLAIDADEVVSKTLQNEIVKAIKEGNQTGSRNNYSAYYIRRRDHFWGSPVTHGELSSAYNQGFIRLFKKGSGEWRGEVHEAYMTSEPAGRLNSFLEHYPHQTVASFIEEVNHYSTIRATELQQAGQKPSLVEIVLYPFAKFIYTYIAKSGYRDGAAGFVYSFLMSFHSFLVRAKLYQYQELDRGK